MASYNPPLYFFDDIVFDSSYYTNNELPNSGKGITLAEANRLYLQKTVADTATAFETFSSGILSSTVTTSSIDSSVGTDLNIGISPSKLGSISIGTGLGSTSTISIGGATTPIILNSSTIDMTTQQTIGGVGFHTLNNYPLSYSGGKYDYSFTGQTTVQLPDTLTNIAVITLSGTLTATPTLFLPLNPYLGQVITVIDKAIGNFVINGGNSHNLNLMGGNQISYTCGTGTYGTFQFDGTQWLVSNFYIGTGAGNGFKVGNMEAFGNGNNGITMFSQQIGSPLNIGSNSTRSGTIGIGSTSGATNAMNLNTGSTGLVTISSITGILSLPSLIGNNYWSYTATNATQTYTNGVASVCLFQTQNSAGSTGILTHASGIWTNVSGRTLFIQGSYTFALVGNALGTRVAALYVGTNNVQYGTYGSPYTLTATNWTATSGFTFSLPTTQSFSLNGFQSGVAGGLTVVSSSTSGTSTNINFIAV